MEINVVEIFYLVCSSNILYKVLETQSNPLRGKKTKQKSKNKDVLRSFLQHGANLLLLLWEPRKLSQVASWVTVLDGSHSVQPMRHKSLPFNSLLARIECSLMDFFCLYMLISLCSENRLGPHTYGLKDQQPQCQRAETEAPILEFKEGMLCCQSNWLCYIKAMSRGASCSAFEPAELIQCGWRKDETVFWW